MPRLGVFGLMASGKSTVSRLFEEWGAIRIDGDALGWEVLREPEIAAALDREFGREIRSEAGDIERAALGRVVFRDPVAMDRLNAVVQPRLLARVREAMRSPAALATAGPILLDAAMLTTWGLEAELDGVVEVRAPEAEREARIIAARGFEAAEARARIRGQQLPPVRNAVRHWIIHNDGDLAELRRRAETVWKEIAALS